MYSFPLEPDETIIKKCLASYSCEGDVLNGALYLTDHRLVFVGYSLSIANKYMDEVLLTHIKTLGTEKTFFVIPNVLKVVTIKDKVIKFVVKGRNQWLAAINNQIDMVN
ncbi:GRAM domain-containing protein [Sporomusa sp.]|uniref:GRAM domain-containing protein n=1 Tax=Sporomusa sp. TaxID=2078658 RepID=UPI002C5449F9|nr:GRAM domain-containing protein [Sporomusa sp.]HWR43865.1 GRAM domain-containing protein [Sporomusa sp.]